MHRKIRLYLGKIQLYLHRESASRVTGESAVAPAVTVLDRPSPTCPYFYALHGLPRPNWTQWGCWCSSVVAQVEL